MNLFAGLGYVTAAALNQFVAELTALNLPVWPPANLAGPIERSEGKFTLHRQRRYLVFKSQGDLVDPTGANPSVSLSEQEGEYTSLDLDSVEWLAYGMEYRVTGVSTCYEDDLPV